MAAYRTELIRKIVRLLESDQQGEVASAAGKLVNMAKEQGHNLDEMLSAVYGAGAGSAKPYQRKSPAGDWDAAQTAAREKQKQERYGYRDHHKFDDAGFGFWRTDDDFVAKKERAEREARAAEEERQRQSKRPTFHSTSLRHLSEFFDAFGCLPLTKWEGDFVVDILDRSDWRCVPTPRQLDVIEKILTKYRNYRSHNGDEGSFWKV